MAEGFIQGDAGEVKLLDIVPLHLQGSFLTRERQEAIAAKWEAEHPHTVVVRPWEEIPDHVIPLLDEKERTQAFAARKQLDERRAKRKALEPAKPALLAGDPDRMAHELRRVRQQLAGLGSDHPEYDKLWTNYTTVINQIEDVCGLPRTEYQKGQVIEKQAESPIAPELLVKIEKYKKLPREKRERSIIVGENPGLIALIRDNEPEQDLQDLCVQRLMQLGALA